MAFTPPPPPETKHTITAEEFIKAAKGEDFQQESWFYRASGKQIKQDNDLKDLYWWLSNEQEYIVLKETACTENLLLEGIGKGNTKPVFIFWKCELLNITIRNSRTNDLIFNKSKIGDIRILGESKTGYIRISGKSQIGDIRISEKSQIGDIRIDEESQIGDIRISGKSQIGDISISGKSQIGDISISGKSESGYIRILGESKSGYIRILGESKIGDIRISGKSQIGYIGIDEESESGDISILGESQSGEIRIEAGSQSGSISILGESQSGYIRVLGKSQSGYIIIEDESQSGEISILGESQSGYISISGKSQSGYISINNSRTAEIEIAGNYFDLFLHKATVSLIRIRDSKIHQLRWTAGTKGELYIEDSQINHLDLTSTVLSGESVLSLINTSILIAQLEQLTVTGKLIFRNIPIQETPFSWGPPIKSLLLEQQSKRLIQGIGKVIYKNKVGLLQDQKRAYNKNVKKLQENFANAPLFRVANSSLGKTEITGCDLQNFRFEYRNSKLLDAFLSGTWLRKDKIEVYKEQDKKDGYEQKISIYNQLKKIYDGQGDIIEGSIYHAKTMKYQQKLLWWSLWHKKEGFSTKTERFFEWPERFFEWLGFGLNGLSNNHGESWLLALMFTCTITFLFFCCTVCGLYDCWSWFVIKENIGKLPGFFLPTHAIDYVSKNAVENPPNSYFFWDLVSRIFIGYGIYQFIVAFRRHGRK